MRYTRQLATAALIVAAGLGMGACSAHPGAAVSTNNGDYSIAEVDEAVSQLAAVTGGQSSIGAQQVRASLINEPQLAAVADSVGVGVTDEQIDQAIEQAAAQSGGQAVTPSRPWVEARPRPRPCSVTPYLGPRMIPWPRSWVAVPSERCEYSLTVSPAGTNVACPGT